MDTKKIIKQLYYIRRDVGNIYKGGDTENGGMYDPWRIIDKVITHIELNESFTH